MSGSEHACGDRRELAQIAAPAQKSRLVGEMSGGELQLNGHGQLEEAPTSPHPCPRS